MDFRLVQTIRQSKTFEDLCGPWKTLQREEFCSQVPRHLTLNKTPKRAKKTDDSTLNLR